MNNRRRALLAAAVGAALLVAPASVMAGKPPKVTNCTVSAGVTTTSVRSKGSVTLTINGTSAADTIDCSAYKAGVVINGHGGSDTITGTPYADSITDGAIGPGGSTYISALGGNDIITVGFGDVTASSNAEVDAGPGDDQVRANGGFVIAFGGDGNDLLGLESAYGAQADGGLGNDTINGPSQAVDPNLCACLNVLDGGAGDDVIVGGAGNDQIDAGPGFDQMHGGPGDDGLTDYDGAGEIFDCGDGTDVADDFDGNGYATDGTPGYLNAPDDDSHPGCELIQVAVSP